MNIQSLFPCLFDLTFVFFYFSVKKLVNCKDWNLMNWTSQKKIVEVDLSREDDYLSLWHLKQFQACVVIIILSWKFNSQGGLPKIWAFFLSKQFLPVLFRVLIFCLNETFYSPYEKRLMLHRSSAKLCYWKGRSRRWHLQCLKFTEKKSHFPNSVLISF